MPSHGWSLSRFVCFVHMLICLVYVYLWVCLCVCLRVSCFAGGIVTAMDAIVWLACLSTTATYIKMFTFTFQNLLFSGGTWGLLAEQQDVQVIPTAPSSQHFMHIVVFRWFVFEWYIRRRYCQAILIWLYCFVVLIEHFELRFKTLGLELQGCSWI